MRPRESRTQPAPYLARCACIPKLERWCTPAFKTAKSESASVPHRNSTECFEGIAANQWMTIARKPPRQNW